MSAKFGYFKPNTLTWINKLKDIKDLNHKVEMMKEKENYISVIPFNKFLVMITIISKMLPPFIAYFVGALSTPNPPCNQPNQNPVG